MMTGEEKALFEMPHDEFEAKAIEALDQDPRDLARLVLMQDVAYKRGTTHYQNPTEQEPFMRTWSMLDFELIDVPSNHPA